MINGPKKRGKIMNVLFIDACVRKNSRTHRLAKEVLQQLNGQVTEINLAQENIQPLSEQSLAKRAELLSQQNYDHPIFRYARQFAQADLIVVAAPFWDLSFPAMLKCFIEAISIVGITFRYGKNGKIEGLCKADKLIYVTTAGGYIDEHNFGYGYIKALATTLFGVKKTQFFKADGLDIIGADEASIMQKAIAEVDVNL